MGRGAAVRQVQRPDDGQRLPQVPAGCTVTENPIGDCSSMAQGHPVGLHAQRDDCWWWKADREQLEDELNRALIALWRIRMEAERSSADEPVWQLPNRVIHLALAGMGKRKQLAQQLAAGAAQ
jgi:hypothetical protein